MRKRKIRLIATLCFATTFVGSISLTSATVKAATTTGAAITISTKDETYDWNKAKTGAGGGFIPAVIFNQGEKDLIYTRTDMGGVYRWNPSSKTWKALTDWVSHDDWNLLGCESLAADPVETNRVYLAAGTYTNDWSDDNGAILRSTDKGDTFERIDLPFKIGGNMPGRSMGERLVIDPNDNKVLYLGTHNGNGLWKSTDYGTTWAKVDSFTAVGDYADPYFKDKIGVVWVAFDPSTGSKGNASRTIYVGVADTKQSIYRSTDGGATWSAVEGQPTVANQSNWVTSSTDSTPKAFLPHHGVLSSDGYLYVSYSNTCGPYDGAKGDVWKYNTKTGEWKNISPVKPSSSDNFSGYAGLAVDVENPKVIMVTNLNWWPDVQMYRSTDGGENWTPIWSWGSYPERKLNYTQDISKAPWLDWGEYKSIPEVTPKLGWMVGGISIDPFNSDRMMYGTGATLYGTDNLTNWDKGEKVDISVKADGIEESSVSSVISPPEGANLISGMGDICGFRHDDLTKAPNKMMTTPNFNTTSIDYAELKPNFIVRSGNVASDKKKNVRSCGFSYDGGKNWFAGTDISNLGTDCGGTVAAAADASIVVWSPTFGSISYSKSNGSSWTACTGIPNGAKIASDRVNPKVFYGLLNGKFYRSNDGGATFKETNAVGLPKTGTDKFKAVPGKEGEIWLTSGSEKEGLYGMWHSKDYGETFIKIEGIQEADTIGYGKAANGSDYVSIYTNAKIDGVRGFFRSNNEGKTWTRINDDKHQYGSANADISGDPRIYGRVYIATNGLGVVYGDATSKPNQLMGDSNNDGNVDISDYLAIQKHIMDESFDINMVNSDLNNDGRINTADLFTLRKMF
jgi:xyloglucan-specific exo-beta-1,4-glucanase